MNNYTEKTLLRLKDTLRTHLSSEAPSYSNSAKALGLTRL